jgi:hypothetical protein
LLARVGVATTWVCVNTRVGDGEEIATEIDELDMDGNAIGVGVAVEEIFKVGVVARTLGTSGVGADWHAVIVISKIIKPNKCLFISSPR